MPSVVRLLSNDAFIKGLRQNEGKTPKNNCVVRRPCDVFAFVEMCGSLSDGKTQVDSKQK